MRRTSVKWRVCSAPARSGKASTSPATRSKEAIILYGMANVAALGAKGIRINCTAPGVTDTPILDQLRTAYGPEFLDAFQTPLGRVSEPSEQAAVLVFLNSKAASYITGQVLWVDGGTIGETDLAGSVPRR